MINIFDNISKLGIGFMRFPKKEKEQITEKDKEMIKFCFEHNINYFESCYFYLDGKCDEIVYELLKEYDRNKYYLANKMPINNFIDKNISPTFIFQDQLNKFHTNYFDYYLIQAIDKRNLKTIIDKKIIEFLDYKKKIGKIKFLGFSFHDNPIVLEEVLKLYDWDFVQIQLNYLDYFNGIAKELVEILEKNNLPFIVMCATKGGLLESNSPIFREEWNKKILHKTETALSFLKDISPNCKVILRDLTELESLNLHYQVLMQNFNEKTNIKILEEFSNYYRNTEIINCTSCKYCETVCPQKLPISYLFNIYNEVLLNKSILDKQNYNVKTYLNKCLGCQKCSNICPQHLYIPQLFANKLFNLRY